MTRIHDIHLIATESVVGAGTPALSGPWAEAQTAMSGSGGSVASSMTATAFAQDRNHIVLAPRGVG
ncbi:MAG TPA: hypothetical protein VHX62_06725 [Solirubrobacteraceae bacterium]|jgi:hypothetical protein|nr:hypothetical protein [Solirubrobacteraceae bacterium]